MAAATPRSVTPIIAKLRNLMNGRSVINHCRYEEQQYPRSPTGPPAKMPYGVSHQLAANYYYNRDGRRESMPAVVAYEAGTKALESGESTDTKAQVIKAPVPGLKVYNWDM